MPVPSERFLISNNNACRPINEEESKATCTYVAFSNALLGARIAKMIIASGWNAMRQCRNTPTPPLKIVLYGNFTHGRTEK